MSLWVLLVEVPRDLLTCAVLVESLRGYRALGLPLVQFRKKMAERGFY